MGRGSRRVLDVSVSVVLRAVLLAVLWVALAGWTADYAVYGLVSVALAVVFSLALLPPRPARLRSWPARAWGLATLAAWFLGQSVRGGVDVALRALRPAPDIEPAVLSAPIELPAGPARQVALILMNLMPGSMVQRMVTAAGETADALDARAHHVELHTLSTALQPVAQWRGLQWRVGRALGTESIDATETTDATDATDATEPTATTGMEG